MTDVFEGRGARSVEPGALKVFTLRERNLLKLIEVRCSGVAQPIGVHRAVSGDVEGLLQLEEYFRIWIHSANAGSARLLHVAESLH